MSKLVLFQWGRLGDLVQTGIVLDRWRSQYDGPISLVYDRRYQDVVHALMDVDDGIPIDLESLVNSTREECESGNALAILNEIVGNTPSLRGGSHLVLSRSPSAALMSHLLKPDQQFGYTWTGSGLRVPQLLSEYLNEPAGLPYPIHICDVWSALAELRCTLVHAGRQPRSQTSSERILIFSDAGESYRTPPIEWLANLGDLLIQKGKYKLTFAGGKRGLKDDSISQLSEIHRNHVMDLRGQTSLNDVIDLCRNHSIVISSDTGGLHLAAACGCRIIGLYFGGASVYNTGPYSEHADVLQNPEWNQSELENILRLLQIGRSPSDLRFLKPVWDAGGITYTNMAEFANQTDDLRNARSNFLHKWMLQSKKPYQMRATIQTVS